MNSLESFSVRKGLLISLLVLSALTACVSPSHAASAADTTAEEAGGILEHRPAAITFSFSPFDTVSQHEYSTRHPFSIDHFFENMPGFVIGRMGPIGADVAISRYGIGMGRSTVYMAGIPINDPQNDIAPLAVFPATTIEGIVADGVTGIFPGRSAIEGEIEILERLPLPDRPYAAIELSKSRFNLRQRRVRFASPQSELGIDLGYDELLNDGYQFDARDIIFGKGYGRSFSRFHTMNLRGALPGGTSFLFSFRWFRNAFQGDLLGSKREHRRSGHFAVLSTSLQEWQLTLFKRGYDSSLPDSHTVNETNAAYVTYQPIRSTRKSVSFNVGLEDIVAEQVVGGATSNPRLQKTSIGGNGILKLRKNTVARVALSLSHHFEGKSGWGGEASLRRVLSPSQEVAVSLRRSFRLPNLGERFLPLHASYDGTAKIVGNRYLGAESAWEGSARIRSTFGPLENEIRLTAMHIQDPIIFLPQEKAGEKWVIPVNGESEEIGFFEDRFDVGSSLIGTSVRLSGGFVYASGKRRRFFSPVPRIRLDASLSIGRELFKSSSAVLIIGEYQYSDARRAFPGDDSPPYGVFNLRFDARLVDAHLYLLWLNVFDREYQTIGPFRMTPRSLVYGVQWTIFN